jgi:hypothetical protein
LSFYTALGLPIIIASPIGSQEDFNRRWLLKSGFGIDQGDIEHVKDWLYDWIDSGYLAEMAMEGYIEGEREGVLNSIMNSSLEEQAKTMNLEQFRKNVDFAKRTGIKEFYFWGGEWWYYMLTTYGDDKIWNEVKEMLN